MFVYLILILIQAGALQTHRNHDQQQTNRSHNQSQLTTPNPLKSRVSNKGKEKETVKDITEEENGELVEVNISDSEGPFYLLADRSIVTTSQVNKKHRSGANLLYIFIKKIMFSFTKIQ